jgi:hypothetical protein
MSQPAMQRRHGAKQRVTVRLSRPVHDALIAATRASGRSLTGEVEAAIAEAFRDRAEAARLSKEPLAALSATIAGLGALPSGHLELIARLIEALLDRRQSEKV